jgi:hypothetical protein
LAERHIFIVPRVGVRGQGENYTEYAHDRDDEDLTTIIYEYDIIDGDTGEQITTSGVGYGSDKGDKGAYKASTGAFKYMLMRLFMVATGDDPEGDERTDQRTSGGPSVHINASSARAVGRGGRSDDATTIQINTIKRTSKELGLGVQGMASLIERVLGDPLTLPPEETKAAAVISAYLDKASSDQLGLLIGSMKALGEETGGIDVDEALSLKIGEFRDAE